jgi:hypothetical protein
MKLFSLLFVLSIFLSPVNTNAAIFNFGGQIVGLVPCTCSPVLSWTLYIRDPRYQVPIGLVYYPGITLLYKLYQPRPAVNSLGRFSPGAVCLIYAGTSCVTAPIPPIGTMIQLGTSAAIGI